jgi:hypothetical protein
MSAAGNTEKAINVNTSTGGDHDRVASLSIRVDGSLDQSPGVEIIGDKDAALEITKRQFAERAVSAIDASKRAELGLAGSADEGSTADKAIDALRKAHDAAAAAGEKEAERIVNQLSKG